MLIDRRMNVWTMTMRSIFLISLLGFIAVTQATYPVSKSFDSGSANLATTFQEIKASIPHTHLPNSSSGFENAGSWGTDYGEGIAKVVGPSFGLAILSLLAGILYGLFKCIRAICCSKSDDDYYDEEEPEYTAYEKWVPSAIYAFCWAWLLFGMILGLLNNPRFTSGIDDMGNDVINVGNQSLALGNGLISQIEGLIDDVLPESVQGIMDQLSGLPSVAQQVNKLSTDVNITSMKLLNLSAEAGAINASSVSELTQLLASLRSIESSSSNTLSQLSTLTYQVGTKLQDSMNSTVANLNSGIQNINGTVDNIISTANGLISDASDLVNKITKYVHDVENYDQIREKVFYALFAFVIAVTTAIIPGFITRIKAIFNTVAAFGFSLLVLLWLGGGIHFLAGMILGDACPIINTVVTGLMPNSGTGANVIQGCMFDNRPVLQSMNITAFNLSNVFDYKTDFEDFTNFAETFNYTTIDDYFNSVQTLSAYNLTAVAANLTVANFGWNQSYVYDTLNTLNNLTYPNVYGLNNYTSANPNSYPYPQNNSVAIAQSNVTLYVNLNTTIYNQTATVQQELIQTQNNLNILLMNISSFRTDYDDIKAEINTLDTQNVTNAINIINLLQSNITAFTNTGNCSFLGTTYTDILNSLCGTMQPAVDLMTIACFLAGIALIPMVVTAEILSFRLSKNRISPDDEEEYKYTKKTNASDYVTVAPSKESSSRSITATIGSPLSSPPNTKMEFNSGDYSDNNSTTDSPGVGRHLLPPIKRKDDPPV